MNTGGPLSSYLEFGQSSDDRGYSLKKVNAIQHLIDQMYRCAVRLDIVASTPGLFSTYVRMLVFAATQSGNGQPLLRISFF